MMARSITAASGCAIAVAFALLGCGSAAVETARAPTPASARPSSQAEPTSEEREIAARESFRAADSAFERKDFRAAAIAYENAFRLAPHGVAAYNAALSWQQVPNEEPREADNLSRALATPSISEEQTDKARARLAELERDLGRVRVEAPAGSRVWLGGADGAAAPVTVHLRPGQHEVRVETIDGKRHARAVQARAGVIDPVIFEAPAPVAPADEGTAQWVLGFTGVGVSAVLIGTAIGLGVATLDAVEAFEASGETDAALRDEAVTLRTWTTVAWVGAGAFAGAGVILLLTAPTGGDDEASVESALTIGPGSVSLRGSW
jgi:hypothetical protein